jgi:hypothetical protein
MVDGGKPEDLADGHKSILSSTFRQRYNRQSRPSHENRHKLCFLAALKVTFNHLLMRCAFTRILTGIHFERRLRWRRIFAGTWGKTY